MALKNKRKTPGGGISIASSKRQKLGGAKAGLSKKRKVANIDSLSWTPVDVPEMFNDAEGFYNLEMIEGVEVVKAGDKVEFVSGSRLLRRFNSDTGAASRRRSIRGPVRRARGRIRGFQRR